MADDEKSIMPKIGAATKKTIASLGLIKKEAVMAVSIMIGERSPGLSPVATEFWMAVTSPVRRVTREEVVKWSVFAKENS